MDGATIDQAFFNEGVVQTGDSPVLYTGVPQDPASVLSPVNPLGSAYASAGISRADVLKGIENNNNAAARAAAGDKLKLQQTQNSAWLNANITAGLEEGSERIGRYKKLAPVPDLGYVTAAQAKLYIGGILVDECYDVQYQYKEYKEPVYGYNDKWFGAVLKGNVIISGTFTINYKHDAYLVKLLDKVANENGGSTSIEAAWAKKEAYEQKVKNYKASLEDFKWSFNKITDMKKELSSAQASLGASAQLRASASGAKYLVSAGFDAKKAALERKKLDFLESLSDADKTKVLEDEQRFVSATSDYTFARNMLNQDIQDSDNKLQATMSVIEENKNIVTACEIKLQQITNWLNSGDSTYALNELKDAEFKTNRELENALEVLAVANKDEQDLLTQRDVLQKSWSTTMEETQQAVEDTLDANSRQYVQFSLQKEKLELEEEAAYNQAETEITRVNRNYEDDEFLRDNLDRQIKDAETEQNKLLSSLTDLKNDINGLNDEVMRLTMNKEYANTSYTGARAEDHGTWLSKPFAMFLEYNGVIHKIIEDCTLTGHGHVIAQGGEVIKEYYTFIAKKIR